MALRSLRAVSRMVSSLSIVCKQTNYLCAAISAAPSRRTLISQPSAFLLPRLPVALSKRSMSRPAFTRAAIVDSTMLVLKLFDKINPEKLQMDSHFHNDLGLDSLDHVEIIMAIEDEYSFEIPDMDAQKLLRPVDIVQYLCDKFDVYDYLDREGQPIPGYVDRDSNADPNKVQECDEDPWVKAGVGAPAKGHH